MILVIIAFFTLLAGYFKGQLDAIADEELKKLDWHNKYDLTKNGRYKHWWYFGLHKPTFPEKFPFSSTALVFLTDRWHRTQFFMLRSFYLAIAVGISANLFTTILVAFVVLPVLLGVPFELSYKSHRRSFKAEKHSSDVDYF
jgi:hypothetical protein